MKALLAAEQALLGAVLLEPGQLGCLDWLQPDDFRRPAHGALFAALRTLRADGHPAAFADEAVPLSWVTDAVDEANRHVRGLDAAYAHTLVEACPRPAHAPVYGRMVLEGAIHRTVAEQAISLDQAARADAVRGEVESTLHRADALAGVLAGLARRWGSDPRPAAPAVPPATAPAPAPRLPDDRASEEDEEFLLAVLVGRPRAMDDVVAWLRPGDFADPAHGRLYGCLTALHHRGEPIDRITALWEAQRRGLLADGTLNIERLAALRDAIGPGSAPWLAERVLHSAITRTAAASARTIRALAEDDALAPGLLIRHALHALRPLNDVRTRRQAAHDGPPPATPTHAPSPITRVDAALSRSTPHQAPPSPQQPRPAAEPLARWHPRGRG